MYCTQVLYMTLCAENPPIKVQYKTIAYSSTNTKQHHRVGVSIFHSYVGKLSFSEEMHPIIVR